MKKPMVIAMAIFLFLILLSSSALVRHGESHGGGENEAGEFNS